VWGYPYTVVLMLVLSGGFVAGVVASDTTNSLYAIVGVAAGYPAYKLLQRARTTTRA
jgi:hypothetical protein